MDQAECEGAINRLVTAAELVVAGASEQQRLDTLGMLVFFRLRLSRIPEQGLPLDLPLYLRTPPHT